MTAKSRGPRYEGQDEFLSSMSNTSKSGFRLIGPGISLFDWLDIAFIFSAVRLAFSDLAARRAARHRSDVNTLSRFRGAIGKRGSNDIVGQWAAPFLIIGNYNKMVKQHGSDAQNLGAA